MSRRLGPKICASIAADSYRVNIYKAMHVSIADHSKVSADTGKKPTDCRSNNYHAKTIKLTKLLNS